MISALGNKVNKYTLVSEGFLLSKLWVFMSLLALWSHNVVLYTERETGTRMETLYGKLTFK